MMIDPMNSDVLQEIIEQLTEMYERIYGCGVTDIDRQFIEFWARSIHDVNERATKVYH